jgi:hypothetical protein
MFANIEKEQKSTWEKTVEGRWMKKPTGSTDLKHQRSDMSLEVKTASRDMAGGAWVGGVSACSRPLH